MLFLREARGHVYGWVQIIQVSQSAEMRGYDLRPTSEEFRRTQSFGFARLNSGSRRLPARAVRVVSQTRRTAAHSIDNALQINCTEAMVHASTRITIGRGLALKSFEGKDR